MSISHSDYLAMQARCNRGKGFSCDVKTGVDRESTLHDDIIDECRRRGWIAFYGSMARATHRVEGEPDFLIVMEGRILMVECKTRTGKLSPAQQAVAAHAAKLGHTVHVVRCMDEFLKVVNE